VKGEEQEVKAGRFAAQCPAEKVFGYGILVRRSFLAYTL
jgi:hypothetical protein